MFLVARKLVSNAIEHSPNGDEVKITLSYGAKGIQLRIRNQGPGIPEDELPDIFDRWYGYGGPELQLSHVKSLLQRDGGTIEAKNIPKGGVEFIVRLPASIAITPPA
jgi:signal transduction histidine kinase